MIINDYTNNDLPDEVWLQIINDVALNGNVKDILRLEQVSHRMFALINETYKDLYGCVRLSLERYTPIEKIYGKSFEVAEELLEMGLYESKVTYKKDFWELILGKPIKTKRKKFIKKIKKNRRLPDVTIVTYTSMRVARVWNLHIYNSLKHKYLPDPVKELKILLSDSSLQPDDFFDIIMKEFENHMINGFVNKAEKWKKITKDYLAEEGEFSLEENKKYSLPSFEELNVLIKEINNLRSVVHQQGLTSSLSLVGIGR